MAEIPAPAEGIVLTHFIVASHVDRHARTGGPLHADMTVLLLARGAKPHEDGAGTAAEAELLGHWLAAEIVSAWTCRAGLTETRAITGRIQRDRADSSETGHPSPVGMLRPYSRADGAQARERRAGQSSRRGRRIILVSVTTWPSGVPGRTCMPSHAHFPLHGNPCTTTLAA